jgi:hypothetical protein
MAQAGHDVRRAIVGELGQHQPAPEYRQDRRGRWRRRSDGI